MTMLDDFFAEFGSMPAGEALQHAQAPYDPNKAHEYYLRYRKLHPRAKGSKPDTGSYDVSRSGGKQHVTLSAAQLAEQKMYAEHRVKAISDKLKKLNAALKKKLAEAKKTAHKAPHKPTAADKSKDSREAKKYRDKHQQEIKTKQHQSSSKAKSSSKASDDKSPTVESLKKQINLAKQSLKNDLAKLKELNSAKKSG